MEKRKSIEDDPKMMQAAIQQNKQLEPCKGSDMPMLQLVTLAVAALPAISEQGSCDNGWLQEQTIGDFQYVVDG